MVVGVFSHFQSLDGNKKKAISFEFANPNYQMLNILFPIFDWAQSFSLSNFTESREIVFFCEKEQKLTSRRHWLRFFQGIILPLLFYMSNKDAISTEI